MTQSLISSWARLGLEVQEEQAYRGSLVWFLGAELCELKTSHFPLTPQYAEVTQGRIPAVDTPFTRCVLDTQSARATITNTTH